MLSPRMAVISAPTFGRVSVQALRAVAFAPGTSEDKVMEAALDAGAEDVVANEDGSIEVVTGPNDFLAVKEKLEKGGLKPEVAEVTMKPTTKMCWSAMRVPDAEALDRAGVARRRAGVYTTAVIDTE